jgi:hypothetical protein
MLYGLDLSTTALGGVVVWQQRRRMYELCGEAIAVQTFAKYWLKVKVASLLVLEPGRLRH